MKLINFKIKYILRIKNITINELLKRKREYFLNVYEKNE